MQGSIAFFGTYAVEDGGKTLVMRIENGTFPNWAGVEQRRGLTLNGDEMTYTTPGSGGVAAAVTLDGRSRAPPGGRSRVRGCSAAAGQPPESLARRLRRIGRRCPASCRVRKVNRPKRAAAAKGGGSGQGGSP